MNRDGDPFKPVNPPPRNATATTQVEDTYYGQPVVKAPHWRWLIIGYFFVGGIAGGSFSIATLADLLLKNRNVARIGRYLSLAAIVASMPLLILDLGRPERFLNMLRVVKLRSPMSLGSWALNFLGLFASAGAALQLLADVTGRKGLEPAQRLVGLLGMPFSLFVSGYTGLLLAITNIPVWARFYPFLGPTFLASAFSTSLATISLTLGITGKEDRDTVRKLARAESAVICTELTLLTAGLVRLGKARAPLTQGKLARIFWSVTVAAGLLAPLGLELSETGRGEAGSPWRRRLASILVLTGGFSLRAVMVLAGRESANRPQDYFEMTRAPRGHRAS